MNALQTFEFQHNAVRVLGTPDAPRFVARDVCVALGISDPASSTRDFASDEKGTHTVQTPGGMQNLLVLTEAGMYRLIFQSRRPEAEAFRRWVTHDVLPAVRRTGAYVSPAIKPTQAIKLSDQLRAMAELATEQERLEAEQQEQGNRLTHVEQKLQDMDGNTGYLSVLAYLRRRGVAAPNRDAISYGQKAAAHCRRNDIRIGKVADERWGNVGTYPITVLDALFDAFYAPNLFPAAA